MGILPDLEGAIWVSTEGGITCFTQEGEIITSIYTNDGLNDNFFARFDPFLSSDGHLFFGNQKNGEKNENSFIIMHNLFCISWWTF